MSTARGGVRRQPVLTALTSLTIAAVVGLIAIPAAAAVTLPGAPGTPVALGIQAGAALSWSAPADVGSPALTRYRVEANAGSGWTAVTAEQGASSVAAGFSHACALLDDSTVRCWGANYAGQLGQGDTADRGDGPGEMGDSLPAVALGTGRTAVALVAGGAHTCALLDDSTVKCWGNNGDGELGQGDTANRGDGPGEMGDSLPTVALGTGRTAVALTSGASQTCALLDDSTVKCWGWNWAGQLGQGDDANRGDGPGEMGDSLPAVALGTGRTAVAIAAGGHHTCALLDDSTVKCWGDNGSGALGQGDAANRGDGPGEMGNSLPAIALGAGRTAVALVSGSYHTCALLDNGVAKCWGSSGSGQLGQGVTGYLGDGPGEMGDSLPAIALGTGRTAVALTAGAYHTCAVLDNGTAKCWGWNGSGQLGQSDTANRGGSPGEMGDSLPAIALGAGRTAVALAPGGMYSCARLDDSTLKCWGNNDDGQLGQGDTTYRGDGPGEMGDSLPAIALGTGRTVSAARAAVVRLAPGTYQLRVVAVSSAGESEPSAASVTVTSPPAPPAAPTAVSAAPAWTTAPTGTIRVSFTAPADNGRVITGYSATCVSSNGGVTRTKTGTVSPLMVTGLTTAKTYTCTVVATNDRGTGPASAASAAVIVGSPAAPTAVSAVAVSTTTSSGSLMVSFTAGANNGGSAITGYTARCVSSDGGTTRSKTGTVSPLTVTGLTTAKTYTCTVVATNARGTGPASAASAAVIVGSPAAPTAVSAVAVSTIMSSGSLMVSFTAGANNGSAITGYTATCVSSNGGTTRSKTGTVSPLRVTGLATAKTYTCTVVATNARGTGLPSPPSAAVIVGSPAAPTAVTAAKVATPGALRVSFTPGADNGNAITGYTATCFPSNGGVTRTKTGTVSPLTVTGLTTAKTYRCKVVARNARGTGLPSVASAAVIV